jgi:hypothetical protein
MYMGMYQYSYTRYELVYTAVLRILVLEYTYLGTCTYMEPCMEHALNLHSDAIAAGWS